MIRKSLYMIAIIGTISIAEVNAMSLEKTLASDNITMKFENGGTIWCEYADKKGFAPYPGYINEKEYLYDNSTYYLNMNIFPSFVNNKCSSNKNIIVSSNLSGINNISFQNWTSNEQILNSIVFTGNNSQYTGTLFLHPSITKIIFKKEESVITNINIPEVIPNTGSDKENNPFKRPNSPKMIDIYLPDHGHFNKLSISGGIVVTFFNRYNHPIYISFNEVKVPSNTLFVDDRIHITNHHNNNYHCNKHKYKHNKKKYMLRDININGGEYIIKVNDITNMNKSNTIIEDTTGRLNNDFIDIFDQSGNNYGGESEVTISIDPNYGGVDQDMLQQDLELAQLVEPEHDV